MKMVMKKVNYVFWAAIHAFGIYGVTVLIFYVFANQNAFYAVLYNLAMILIFVVESKIESSIYAKIKAQ